MKLRWCTCVLISALSVPGSRGRLLAQAPTLSDHVAKVSQHFAAPPDDAKALMRWWWFGSAVTRPELEREMLAMKAGGFGGFEIQPVYPLALDNGVTGVRNLPYLSPEFLDAVHFAAEKAHENHLRVDLTLSSGWPYGGPGVKVTQASGRLRMVAIEVPAGASSVALPPVSGGEKMIEAFAGKGSPKQFDIARLKPLALQAGERRVSLPTGQTLAVFFLASRTGQQVKRPAVNADGFVLDHLSKAAVEDHLKTVAEPLMTAFGDTPPYSVFSDSLEVYGSDWTDDFLSEFQKRRGYDLAPHLPELYTGQGPNAAAVRHDWGLTQTELVNERYLTPLNDFAVAHHTQFRSQTYGEPAVSLSSNNLVGLPEGEGPQWRSFSFTRWATSASHLYGRPVTSAETWTWLHSPAFRAVPLDMKAEADRMFLEGVNQFVGHGWPYTPPQISEPGWAFYAAAVFNDHNPWWPVMPDVNLYLQRMSYLLRQGKPANDVAVLLPTDDAYASFTPEHSSVSGAMGKLITPALTQAILDAGYNLDYIDAEAIEKLGVKYPVLVMPRVSRLSPVVMEKIAAYVKAGGKVVAVGSLPSLAPGFVDAARISATVSAAVKALFVPGSGAVMVGSEAELGAALKAAVKPDMQVTGSAADVGFVHRKLDDADVYFIANTSNHTVKTTATFRTPRTSSAWWNPYTGEETAAALQPELDLAPYESRVIVFTDGREPKLPQPAKPETVVADLSKDWKVQFPGGSEIAASGALKSWTDDEKTRYFSGIAVYTRDFEVTASELKRERLMLDFGQGTPVEVDPKIASGMRALLESPIREAAVVMVNGQRAGSVWHPPYALEVTKLLHAGTNHVEVRVANTAINTLAGRSLPDYRLLTLRYGQRFVPQDMENLKPLPSGMLGPVRLMGEAN